MLTTALFGLYILTPPKNFKADSKLEFELKRKPSSFLCSSPREKCDLKTTCFNQDSHILGCHVLSHKELEGNDSSLDYLAFVQSYKKVIIPYRELTDFIAHPEHDDIVIARSHQHQDQGVVVSNQTSQVNIQDQERIKDILELSQGEDIEVVKKPKKKFNFKKIINFVPNLAKKGLRELNKTIKTEIKQGSLGFDIPVSQSVWESLRLGAGYAYQVSPSFVNDFYTRRDKWKLNQDVDFVDFFDKYTPLSFSLRKNSEIEYIRHFPTQKTAALSMPYGLKRLPLTAKKAIEDLKPGDFVRIPTTMTLALGANFAQFAENVIPVSQHINFFLSGTYEIQILRLPDDKVLLRVIALRKKGVGLTLRVGINLNHESEKLYEDSSDLIKESRGPLLSLINNIFDLEIFRLHHQRESGELFTLSYQFDLSHEKAQKAYESIMKGSLLFKHVKKIYKLTKSQFEEDGLQKVQKEVFADTSLADEIYQEELQSDRDRSEYIVNKEYQFKNEYNNKFTNFKIGTKIYQPNLTRQYSENFLSFEEEENKHNYLYQLYSNRSDTQKALGLRRERSERTQFGLYASNEDKEPKELREFGYQVMINDTRMTRNERLKLLNSFIMNLPPSLFEKIDWEKIQGTSAEEKITETNATYQLRMTLSPLILTLLSHLKPSVTPYRKTRDEFKAFLENFNPEVHTFKRSEKAYERTKRKYLKKLEKHKRSSRKLIQAIATLRSIPLFELEQGRQPSYEKEKYKALQHILKKSFLEDMGVAFLTYILKNNFDEIKKNKHLLIKYFPQKAEKITQLLSISSFEKVLEHLIYIRIKRNSSIKKRHQQRVDPDNIHSPDILFTYGQQEKGKEFEQVQFINSMMSSTLDLYVSELVSNRMSLDQQEKRRVVFLVKNRLWPSVHEDFKAISKDRSIKFFIPSFSINNTQESPFLIFPPSQIMIEADQINIPFKRKDINQNDITLFYNEDILKSAPIVMRVFALGVDKENINMMIQESDLYHLLEIKDFIEKNEKSKFKFNLLISNR